jgi:DNA repair protein RecO (recombination protein O)
MHSSTKAIVLSKIRYKDKDLIVKCYTKQFGVVSYLLKNILSKKSKISSAYFQQLSLLELETNHKQTRTLQYIQDVKILIPFETLHTNILKSTIVMFISEILSNVLKEEEPNHNLFAYIKTALLLLDKEQNISNFHILFLLNLTKYLGFYPQTNKISYNNFNLLEGQFQKTETSKYCVKGENLTVLKQVLGMKFDEFSTLKLLTHQRQNILNMILLYFELHLGNFKKPKSLTILNQVFN